MQRTPSSPRTPSDGRPSPRFVALGAVVLVLTALALVFVRPRSSSPARGAQAASKEQPAAAMADRPTLRKPAEPVSRPAPPPESRPAPEPETRPKPKPAPPPEPVRTEPAPPAPVAPAPSQPVAAPATSAGGHPHEPPGYVAFAEFPCDRLPAFPRSQTGRRGIWYAYPQGNPNLTLISDPSAPESPPGVCQTRFPAKLQGGRGPVDWGGWDAAGFAEGQKSKLYMSLWIKVGGQGYENHPAGTKVGFLGYGVNLPSSQNQGFFFLTGNGRQEVGSRFSVEFRQQGVRQPNGEVTRNLVQNRSRGAVIQTGRWQHWEAVAEVNDVGRRNGVFRMWVDGALVIEYTDVIYLIPGAGTGFNLWKWNPTWGGHDRVWRNRDDVMLIDDVYLSGVPGSR